MIQLDSQSRSRTIKSDSTQKHPTPYDSDSGFDSTTLVRTD